MKQNPLTGWPEQLGRDEHEFEENQFNKLEIKFKDVKRPEPIPESQRVPVALQQRPLDSTLRKNIKKISICQDGNN